LILFIILKYFQTSSTTARQLTIQYKYGTVFSMSEFSRETIRLNDQEVAAITSELEKITAQRQELADKDPREFIMGVTEDKAVLSVDELYGVEISEERFIVRYAPLDTLVEGIPAQEQRMTYFEVSRLRDGGTTNMPTRFGKIHRPTPHRPAPTTIDGKVVTPLVELMIPSEA
jgi:hypothetical protein